MSAPTLAERVAQEYERLEKMHRELLEAKVLARQHDALAKLVRAGRNCRNACYECMPLTDEWDTALRELAAALGVEVDNGR